MAQRVRPYVGKVELANLDTIDFLSSSAVKSSAEAIGLTVLAHPDPARVGEVAVLFSAQAGGSRRLSRLEPEFAAASGERRDPLANPAISRKSLRIRTTAQHTIVVEALEGDTRCTVDGHDLPAELPFACLDRGVVLHLSDCALLLLHLVRVEPVDAHLGLLGSSRAIRELRAAIRRIAGTDTHVLIRGESGTGKELVARAIHDHSRSVGPYVAVNAAAVPAEVAASALFGHVKGAFTGAVHQGTGFFAQAEGGTLFLDEIGEIPRSVQAALLRALREGEIQPVGAPKPHRVKVRVLAATDANLEELVDRGGFSLPLLRRLEAYVVEVPPLRARRDDIARLFHHFLRQELERLGSSQQLATRPPDKRPWLSSRLVHALVAAPWPGNVAELQAVARRIAVDNRDRGRIEGDAWIQQRLGVAATTRTAAPPRAGPAGQDPSVKQPEIAGSSARRDPRTLTDQDLLEAMRATHFKVNAAAEYLGVSRSWLHARLADCQLLRKAKDLTPQEIAQAMQQTAGCIKRTASLLEVSEHGLKLRMRALNLDPTAA